MIPSPPPHYSLPCSSLVSPSHFSSFNPISFPCFLSHESPPPCPLSRSNLLFLLPLLVETSIFPCKILKLRLLSPLSPPCFSFFPCLPSLSTPPLLPHPTLILFLHPSGVDILVEPLRATLQTKVKANSVKQEFEKQDELKRSALRAVAALLSVPDSGKFFSLLSVQSAKHTSRQVLLFSGRLFPSLQRKPAKTVES